MIYAGNTKLLCHKRKKYHTMNLQERTNAFASLGDTILTGLNEGSLDTIIAHACSVNPWFTTEHVRYALKAWGDSLATQELQRLATTVPQLQHPGTCKTIAIIMAGNLPLVGMHDWMCVLLAGHKALVKLSSQDDVLLPHLSNMLPTELRDSTTFAHGKLTAFDAVIATGSNNTNRYFDYYFGHYPNIIRHSRNGIAILQGDESNEELECLCDDIFLHFGLGCRSVTKLFVPRAYNFGALIKASAKYAHFADMHLYRSSLDYHKALLLLNSVPFVDGGFWMLQDNAGLAAPVSMVNYEEYDDIATAELWCREHSDELQVIIRHGFFGQAQHPTLTDFADGVNTLQFLAAL